jgi:hypothetical protein
MMATGGGCVGARGVMEAVDFGVKRQQQHQHPSKLTKPTTPSRSDRLYDKDALLYHNPAIINNNAHSNKNGKYLLRKTPSQQPDEADWGVTPTRRGTGGVMAMITPTASNKTVHHQRTTATTTTTTPRKRNSLDKPLLPSRQQRAATPTERLRSFDKRKSIFSSNKRPITPTRARSLEAAATSREKKRLNEQKMRKQQMEAQHQQQHEDEDEEEDEAPMMMDITSRHHNHRQQQQQQEGPALFESARNASSTPERKRPSPNKQKKKKKQQQKNGALRLFEHVRKEYDERDRRRRQAIVHTVRSMEASASNFHSSGENNSSIMDTDTGSSKYTPLVVEEEEHEDSWDENHYAAVEKLNAGLDPIQQHRDAHQEEDFDDEYNENVPGTALVAKTTVKTVTDWGVEAIVSDLSCNSLGTDSASAVPFNEELPHPTTTTATQRLQQALAEAKKHIYPKSNAADNYSAEVAKYRVGAGSAVGEWDGDEASDQFDETAHDLLYEGQKSPREGLRQGTRTSTCRQAKKTPTNASFHRETTTHANTTARSHSFEVSRPSSSSDIPTIQRARSKSPDPFALLSLGPPRRSRSNTPERLRKHSATKAESRALALMARVKPEPSIDSGRNRNSGDSVLKSLTSGLPSKDRRSSHQEETPSAASSQRRSVTPNRLWASRRRPTPGQIMLASGSNDFIDAAEEKLKAIQKQRRQEGNDFESVGSFDRLSVSGGAVRRKSLGGIVKNKGKKQINKSPKGLKNGRGGASKGFGGDASLASRSIEHEGHYIASPRSSREPPSKRWFGRGREEVPADQDKFEALLSSVDSNSTRGRGIAKRLSSILGATKANELKGHLNNENEMMSQRMMKHMMTFDSLMKAIENDKKNELGAEFAVVELGDEETAVQTHAILMNRVDVEDQLNALGATSRKRR